MIIMVQLSKADLLTLLKILDEKGDIYQIYKKLTKMPGTPLSRKRILKRIKDKVAIQFKDLKELKKKIETLVLKDEKVEKKEVKKEKKKKKKEK